MISIVVGGADFRVRPIAEGLVRRSTTPAERRLGTVNAGFGIGVRISNYSPSVIGPLGSVRTRRTSPTGSSSAWERSSAMCPSTGSRCRRDCCHRVVCSMTHHTDRVRSKCPQELFLRPDSQSRFSLKVERAIGPHSSYIVFGNGFGWSSVASLELEYSDGTLHNLSYEIVDISVVGVVQGRSSSANPTTTGSRWRYTPSNRGSTTRCRITASPGWPPGRRRRVSSTGCGRALEAVRDDRRRRRLRRLRAGLNGATTPRTAT